MAKYIQVKPESGLTFLKVFHRAIIFNLQSAYRPNPSLYPELINIRNISSPTEKKNVFTFAEASSFPVTAVWMGPLPWAVFVLLQFTLFGSLLVCFSTDFAFYIILNYFNVFYLLKKKKHKNNKLLCVRTPSILQTLRDGSQKVLVSKGRHIHTWCLGLLGCPHRIYKPAWGAGAQTQH